MTPSVTFCILSFSSLLMYLIAVKVYYSSLLMIKCLKTRVNLLSSTKPSHCHNELKNHFKLFRLTGEGSKLGIVEVFVIVFVSAGLCLRYLHLGMIDTCWKVSRGFEYIVPYC